jgi:hypothetical protein
MMMNKRNSDNISSEDDCIDDEENESEDQNDVDSVGTGEKINMINKVEEEDDQDVIVHLEDNLDEYLDKYSQFESIKHYDQQISNPNGIATKSYVNKSNELLSNEINKNKNYESNNINNNNNNTSFSTSSRLMSNEPLIKRNLYFNHSNFNSLKFKRNHKTAMSTTQILSSAHTAANKIDNQNKSIMTTTTSTSSRGKTRQNNHQLTPIKTTSNLMSMSTINMTNTSSIFNDTTLLNNTSTMNKTTTATTNNTTTSTTNKYFTISAAAGQKFRQILKRYVQ